MTIIYIKTHGCSHNTADSETMAHYLQKAGYEISGLNANVQEFNKDLPAQEKQLMAEADLILYNTCTVKNPTDDKFFSKLKLQTKPVVIAGCIPQSQQRENWLKPYSAVGVNQLEAVVEVVRETLLGNVLQRLGREKTGQRDFIPSVRKNKLIAIIPILQGCLGTCTYCKTKFARGHLKSYSQELLLRQIREAKAQGIQEIWLSSEDNGAYGIDIGTTFPQLLREIAKIGGNFKVRIGMLNPEYAYLYREELATLLQKNCFYKFLHIPLQAANDEVLKHMQRPYTLAQYKEALRVLKEKNPSLSIATDIICGYPTESEEQFQETMDYMKEENFFAINISKFYPRPGTKAAKFQLLPTEIVKARSKLLTQWFATVNYNTSYLGKKIQIYVTELGKFSGTYIGRTENYTPVIVASTEDLLGKNILVHITATTRDDLRGKLSTI